MSFRFAATSGLALAAALVLSNAAGAQSFFSYYEMSPRQIVGMLADDGYQFAGGHFQIQSLEERKGSSGS